MSIKRFSKFFKHEPSTDGVHDCFLLELYTYKINMFFLKLITSLSYRPIQRIAFILILLVRFDTYIDIYGSDERIVSIFRSFLKNKQTVFSLLKTCSDNVSVESFRVSSPSQKQSSGCWITECKHVGENTGTKLTVYPPGRGVAPTDGGEIYVRNSVLTRP